MKTRMDGVLAAVRASAVLSAAVLGCSAPVDELVEGAELGQSAQALRCYSSGVPSNDPNCPWRVHWNHLRAQDEIDIVHKGAPALCAKTNGGWLALSTGTDDKYYALGFRGAGVSRSTSWAAYGSSRTWHSKPACAPREDTIWTDNTTTVGGFVVAGKLKSNDPDDNNRIWASPGRLAPMLSSANPTFSSGFEKVDPDDNAYTTGGIPALASRVDEFGEGATVLTFMGDDSRTIYAHVHNLPYTANDWSERITGPTLPSGWVAVGAPSIVRLGWTYQIVVHARSGTGSTAIDRLYEVHFYEDGQSTQHFSNGIGSPTTSWTNLGSPGTITDGAWITYSDDFGVTAYFRQGTEIMQTALPLGTTPVMAVRPDTGIVFDSAPAATGGLAFDQGTNIVVARSATTNQLYYIESNAITWLGL